MHPVVGSPFCPETKKALTFVRAFLVGVAGLTQPHFSQTKPRTFVYVAYPSIFYDYQNLRVPSKFTGLNDIMPKKKCQPHLSGTRFTYTIICYSVLLSFFWSIVFFFPKVFPKLYWTPKLKYLDFSLLLTSRLKD